jgi:adenylate cyclase
MALEIERKFLVKGDFRPFSVSHKTMIQAYVSSGPHHTVRVRIAGDEAWITIKGRSTDNGLSREEWETPIDPGKALELLPLCNPSYIQKTRYYVPTGVHTYEVDVFEGDNQGLIVAEVELRQPDEVFEKPDWLGQEVTGKAQYYNSRLTTNPYKNWQE